MRNTFPYYRKGNGNMEKSNIKILKFPPMKVASFHATGAAAEQDAFQKLYAWAYSRGFLKDPEKNPMFGFDSTTVARNRKTPGYEIWLGVPDSVVPEDGFKIKEFGGGIFLVMACSTRGNPVKTIPAAWVKLHQWAQGNGYEMGNYPTLERFYAVPLSDDFTIDLYYPVKINVPGMTEDEYLRLIQGMDEDVAFKKLTTAEKINKLKDKVAKTTVERSESKEDIVDIKGELQKTREEIKNIKQVVRSLLEYQFAVRPLSSVPLSCHHVTDEPHLVFITVRKDGTRKIECDSEKPCDLCIYREIFFDQVKI